MDSPEYLVTYGAAGYLGRFVPADGLACQRGDRVLVRSRRGLEVGTVLAGTSNGFSDALSEQAVGELLRLAGAADETLAASVAEALAGAYDWSRELAGQLNLPLEIIDTEAIPEPRTLIVHYLGLAEFDPRPFVSALARQFEAYVELLDLTPPYAKVRAEDDGGHGKCSTCGREGGGCGDGGCGDSCGGCGSGCSADKSKTFADDWQTYFADLRGKMEKRHHIATI